MLGVAQRPPETNVPLYLLVTQSQMSVNARNIVDVRIASNLVVPGGSRLALSCLDQGSPYTLSTHVRLNVPTLNERHGRDLATGSVLPIVKFQEPNDPTAQLRHENDELSVRPFEVPPRFDIMI
jgi:hypothetical protein